MDSLTQELEWGQDNMNKDYNEQLTNLESIDSSMFEFVQKEKKLTGGLWVWF